MRFCGDRLYSKRFVSALYVLDVEGNPPLSWRPRLGCDARACRGGFRNGGMAVQRLCGVARGLAGLPSSTVVVMADESLAS